jgi:hypothetical protein
MSHWHIPATKEGLNRWTPDQVETALSMKADGHDVKEIAERLGRSVKAVQGKFKYIALNEGQREERRQALRRRRIASGIQSTRLHPNGQTTKAERPSDNVLSERARRSAIMPRDLTAAFFGDPLPGYSALDRRQ